jgi:hypothetical protein
VETSRAAKRDLLDQRRAPEVIKLLKDKTRVDSLLLRYALALDRADPAAARVHREALRARFEAAMRRGDSGSCAIAALALGWVAERLFDLQLIS